MPRARDVGLGEAASAASPEPAEAKAPSPEITCWHVVIEALDGIWHHVEPKLKAAADWSETTAKMEGVDDIYAKLQSGEYALWLVIQNGEILAAVVVGTTIHSRSMVIDVHYGAGEHMSTWLKPFCDEIVERGRRQGHRFIRVQGRKGWGKALKAVGFHEVCTTFMREI